MGSYADTCRGGCSWTSHSLLGRPGNNPYCIHRAMQQASRGIRERAVKVGAAPGQPFDHGRFELVEESMEARPIDALMRMEPTTIVHSRDADTRLEMLRTDPLIQLRTRARAV
ncbi:MAG: hypothetical protein AAF799_47990 [Myxococcota bacterium]